MSKWLTWEPSRQQIMASPPGTEPPKPPEPDFVGSGGALSGENLIIRVPEPLSSEGSRSPYTLPEGVTLVQFTRKAPPGAVTVCSVVTEPDKFIRHTLAALDARLRNPVQIRAGDSVFELLSKLADCGLELRLESPPEPKLNAGELGIADQELRF